LNLEKPTFEEYVKAEKDLGSLVDDDDPLDKECYYELLDWWELIEQILKNREK